MDPSAGAGESLCGATPADAVLFGVHSVGAPQADTTVMDGAVIRLRTFSVCCQDERPDALDARSVLVHWSVSCGDAVRRVEADGTGSARRARRPVG